MPEHSGGQQDAKSLGLPGHSCQNGEHLFTVALDGFVCIRCADLVADLPDGEEFDPHWTSEREGVST